jgi:hypothetical protein
MAATVMFGNLLYSIGGTVIGGPGQATSEVDVLPLSDTTAPTVLAPPDLTISPTDPVYPTSVPIHIAAHVTDRSGIAGARLQRSINGGPYTDVTSPWSAADTTVQPDSSYTYRQQYVDGAGNLSAWTKSQTVTAAVDEEGYPGITYAGSWTRTSSPSALGGATETTMSPSASATLTFSGRGVRFLGMSTSQSGFAELIVDGTLQGIYNFAPDAANTVPLTYSWPTSGRHTFEVVDVKGGSGTRIDVDAFVVIA